MGSYNKIGFISSLPIEYGDEATLLFMLPGLYQKKPGGVTYSTDLYEPAFLPIFGTYDDYGRIEDVKYTTVVEFIEQFFGLNIETIIEEVDDASVGRHDTKCSATKNVELYKKLTFGLELTHVYNHMASKKKIAFVEDNINEYWLEKFGFSKSKNEENKWINKVNNELYYLHKGGYGSFGFNHKSLSGSSECYHPIDLQVCFNQLNYTTSITEEDRMTCSIDISIEMTKMAIEKNDPYLEFGTYPRYKEYPNITTFIQRCHLDGTLYDFATHRQPKSLINSVDEKEIADFVRFFRCVSNINAKFQPSNYGSQDQDLLLYIDMIRCYREHLSNKLEQSNDDCNYDAHLNLLKSDDRDDKLINLLHD
jgi:hypothetical protein